MNEAIFGLVGVLVGAMISWAKEFWSEHSHRRRHAKYLAVQVIRELDKFIDDCVSVMRDDGTYQGQPAGRTPEGEMYNVAQVTPPDAPNYPSDLDWKSIDGDLLYQIMMLPNKIRSIDIGISNTSEYDEPPEFRAAFELRWEGYADLGLEALDISNKLRKACKLPQPGLAHYNPRKIFNEKKAEIATRRKRGAELDADFMVVKDEIPLPEITLTTPTK